MRMWAEFRVRNVRNSNSTSAPPRFINRGREGGGQIIPVSSCRARLYMLSRVLPLDSLRYKFECQCCSKARLSVERVGGHGETSLQYCRSHDRELGQSLQFERGSDRARELERERARLMARVSSKCVINFRGTRDEKLFNWRVRNCPPHGMRARVQRPDAQGTKTEVGCFPMLKSPRSREDHPTMAV